MLVSSGLFFTPNTDFGRNPNQESSENTVFVNRLFLLVCRAAYDSARASFLRFVLGRWFIKCQMSGLYSPSVAFLVRLLPFLFRRNFHSCRLPTPALYQQ